MYFQPLPHADVRQKILFAPLAQLAAGKLPLFGVERLPELEQGEEVGAFVTETGVGGIGLFGGFERALAYILDAESGRNDEDLVENVFFLGLQNHATEVWVSGQAG